MDSSDVKLIEQLQKHPDIALAELSRRLEMSKTTCWNRIQRLEEQGVLRGRFVKLNRARLGLSVVVFLSITVGRHSPDWMDLFAELVNSFPEIVEVHRLTGEGADYQLKIICPDIEAYDLFQQRLIAEIDFTSMATKISMKEIKNTNTLPLMHLA